MKQPLSFWALWNMSFGFCGLQFGWSLQGANMTAIYEYLGATPERIPLLWLASSLSGLLVQPLIGHFSDHTRSRFGRRRPFMLGGAILSAVALVLMPNSTSIWMAAALLWLLDAAINTSMHPFRAFVAETLPASQHARGFAMQSLFIGLGATVATALPWIMTNWFHVAASAEKTIPASVRYAFYIGAAAFVGAVVWTVSTTRELPPDEAAPPRTGWLRALVRAVAEMPRVMWQIGLVQACSWLGLFCFFLYFPTAVARDVFGAADEKSPLFREGLEWAGLCFSLFSVVTAAFSFILLAVSQRVSRRTIHTACLLIGAAGLAAMPAIHSKWPLLISMAAFGIAWASILSMPYAMLAGALPPHQTGIYMGLFNLFIVVPQLTGSLGFGWVMQHLLGNSRVSAVVVGGALLAAGAIATQFVREEKAVA
ncbi:MAG: MFS transporter [Chthoniobacteraceae bacterium]